MNTINLTPIFQALIALMAALITYRLIPWIKAKTSNEQRVKIDAAIRTAVFAAEQLFESGHGAEKMDYALNYLREKGYDVDSREVESAVAQFFNIARADHIITLMDDQEENVKDT